jgi:hypothetical protein
MKKSMLVVMLLLAFMAISFLPLAKAQKDVHQGPSAITNPNAVYSEILYSCCMTLTGRQTIIYCLPGGNITCLLGYPQCIDFVCEEEF